MNRPLPSVCDPADALATGGYLPDIATDRRKGPFFKMMKTSSARELNGSDVLVRQDDGLLTAEVNGELIGMSVEQGSCYGFNGVGTRIWALLAEPRSLDDLCAQLLTEFDVDADRCRTEVVALLEELRAEGLVRATGAE
jgi:hypothetical protein